MPRITKISAETYNNTPVETNVHMTKTQYDMCANVNFVKYDRMVLTMRDQKKVKR